MGSIRKHKRIFYRPGMISLVFIPLLCLCYFYKNDSFKVYCGINYSLPSNDDKFFQEIKSKYGYPRHRNYREFSFNDSDELEKNKLLKLQFSLRELIKINDTINGIKIHFGEKTNYAVFISVIDILYIEDVPTWQPDQNDIYVSVGAKSIKKNNFICPGVIYPDVYIEHLEEIERKIVCEKEYQRIIFLFKKYWILFLGYFGIVILNIFTLIKFNKR